MHDTFISVTQAYTAMYSVYSCEIWLNCKTTKIKWNHLIHGQTGIMALFIAENVLINKLNQHFNWACSSIFFLGHMSLNTDFTKLI